VEVHAIGRENCLPSNHKALNMYNSTREKCLPPPPSSITILPKLGCSQKFWTTNQNQSDSCESHSDFDYKHLRSVLVVNIHLYRGGKNYSDNSIVG